jgi:hypothetical protein
MILPSARPAVLASDKQAAKTAATPISAPLAKIVTSPAKRPGRPASAGCSSF